MRRTSAPEATTRAKPARQREERIGMLRVELERALRVVDDSEGPN